MSRLRWDRPRQRGYETGVDRGVLYPKGAAGVPWNGLISVQEATEDSDVTDRYVDGHKYRQTGRSGGFAATIEAFTYPSEFEAQAGFSGIVTQQRRKPFGLSYRTMVGARDYKIHLVYNAMAAPSTLNHKSIADSADLDTYTWGISTTPTPINGAKASSHLYVDSSKAYPDALAEFEALIYGDETHPPTLPSIDEVISLFESYSVLRITEHPNGIWIADGPDEAIVMTDSTTFEITWPSALYIDDVTYVISSL